MENIGFGKRFLAFLLDTIIFGVPMEILQRLMFGAALDDPNNPANMLSLIFSMAATFFYYVGMWTYAGGATVGKKIMKIKVVAVDGSPLTLKRAAGRYGAYILASLPLSLGLLWVIWDKEKRGWHDRLAGTKVISSAGAVSGA